MKKLPMIKAYHICFNGIDNEELPTYKQVSI